MRQAKRFTCPYHAWTYDNTGRLVGLPGREGFPGVQVRSDGLTELPGRRIRRIPLGGTRSRRHTGCRGTPWSARRGTRLVGHRAVVAAGREVLDSPINWKLAVDTFSENYHFATVHRDTFATIARSNCTVFDLFGPHHRLIFPLNSILELENVPEDQWDPFQNMVVIYALFPNIVLSVTIANGELFRIYPADKPGRSITVHQNSTPLDISDESWPPAPKPSSTMPMPRCATRTTGCAGLQANLASGARDHLLFGRNEPGLQHRHLSWASWRPVAAASSAVDR